MNVKEGGGGNQWHYSHRRGGKEEGVVANLQGHKGGQRRIRRVVSKTIDVRIIDSGR